MHTLFLCSGNYYRSRFAEALFNYHAARLGLPDRAFSCGLATYLVKDFPDRISPDTLSALEARNIPLTLTSAYPRQLANADLAVAVRIIALNAGEHRAMLDILHPGWSQRVEFWDIRDVESDTPANQLPLLEAKVLALLPQEPQSAVSQRQ
jgi:protein-tyrosine phosphatase